MECSINDMFKYNAGEKPDGGIRVSPSGVKDLVKNRPYWIKANVLGQREQGDMTNANIGTVLHAMIEGTYLNLYPETILDAGMNYFEFNDAWRVKEQLQIMYKTWKEEYYPVDNNHEAENETWLEFKANDKIWISGTTDRISNGTIIDWKSSSAKVSKIDSYRSQLYLYAFMARKQGYEVHSIRVVGISRPKWSDKTNKFGKCSVSVLDEPIDEEYMKQLIQMVKEASEDIISVLGNQEVMSWLKETRIQDTYDRSYL